MVQQEARQPETKVEDAKVPTKPVIEPEVKPETKVMPASISPKPKPKAKPKPVSDEDKTLFRVKMMRRMLAAESKRVGYQIRLSPEFIVKYDEMIRALYSDALARMKASGAKTLMLEHA
jgi:hypothetical protein